jgi:hypothetical protein
MRYHLAAVKKLLSRHAGRLLKNAEIQGGNLSSE